MKRFGDLNIRPNHKIMVGDKIKIAKVLNKEITILGYKIEDSKYPKNRSGKCLYLQIELDDEKHVIFTGSDVLIGQIQQVDNSDFPILATIVKEGEHFEFK